MLYFIPFNDSMIFHFIKLNVFTHLSSHGHHNGFHFLGHYEYTSLSHVSISLDYKWKWTWNELAGSSDSYWEKLDLICRLLVCSQFRRGSGRYRQGLERSEFLEDRFSLASLSVDPKFSANLPSQLLYPLQAHYTC